MAHWYRPPTGKCDKYHYATEREAVEAMFSILARRIHPVRRAHLCQACGSWHLSSHGDTPSAQLVMLQRLSEQDRDS